MNRNALRQNAKKLYKEKTKKIPKKQRIAFADFFKEYKKSMKRTNIDEPDLIENGLEKEDFDFNDLVNVNMIDDNNLQPEIDLDTNNEETE